MPQWQKQGHLGSSQRSHENRGGGRRSRRMESARDRKRRQRKNESKHKKKWMYAVKKVRETLPYRKAFLEVMKKNGTARPYLPKAMLPEARIDEPCVAVSHFGKGSVVLGRVCGIHASNGSRTPGALCILEIMKVLCPQLLTVRGPGRPPKSVSQVIALPVREVYQCPLSMCMKEGIVWRGSIRCPLTLKKNYNKL